MNRFAILSKLTILMVVLFPLMVFAENHSNNSPPPGNVEDIRKEQALIRAKVKMKALIEAQKKALAQKNQRDDRKKQLKEKEKAWAAARAKTMKTDWIKQVETLYYKDTLSLSEERHLLELLETYLGIEKSGRINLMQARDAEASLNKAGLHYDENTRSEEYNIYFADKLNLLGFNHIYFEVCTRYKERHSLRFINYFENGFFPNQSIFPKENDYYRILYYYIYLVQGDLNNHIFQATQKLTKNPNYTPDFSQGDITHLDFLVRASSELSGFRQDSEKNDGSPYNMVFTDQERAWLKETTDYFTSVETHAALASYDWFHRNIPLAISSRAVFHSVRQTWQEQTLHYRTLLPLVLFMDNGSATISIDTLFETTLNTLKMDNREIDIMILSALKSWMKKQVKHGVKIEDRIKYRDILQELEVCPSGWIFYNLYALKEPLMKLKSHADAWDALDIREKKRLLNAEIIPIYYGAKDRVDLIFNDLEKIYGQEQSDRINYLFNKYRGEINYYFEYLKFGAMEDEAVHTRFALANSKDNCLKDFKAAFIKADDNKANHINLLKAYNLLFRELTSQAKTKRILDAEDELTLLITGNHGLGSILDHKDNNLYDIYKLIANAYLSRREYETRALDVAERSFNLARTYYLNAASQAGYRDGERVGAVDMERTETDDYERQFEFYQSVAGRLGKKVGLMLPDEDIQLYHKMKRLRETEGLLL